MSPKEMMQSTTVQGAVGAFLAFVASPELLGLLPEKAATALGAVATLLMVVGFRKAQGKIIAAVAAAPAPTSEN